uniref:Uncharacterized protein n=1 Tax=Dunaliella tertiolecta TaxID=3047 RepID=A0A7S3VPR1_DUNTE
MECVQPAAGVTDISRVVWAAASLDAKPPALLLHALTARALPGMRSATPHTLTTLLYGLAALGYRPPPAFFTAFFRATAAAMRRTPAKAKNPTDINNTHDCGSSRSSQKGSRVASKTGSNRGLLGSSQPLPVAGSSHVTGRGLARTLWALATLQKDPPSTWLTLATRRLVQELPSCNAHDLTLAALGCAVLGPSLGTRQVSAFGAAVERQRRRRLAMQYERDKVAMVWAWGRLRARIQIDQEEKQRKPQVKGLQQRLRHAASAAQRKANK